MLIMSAANYSDVALAPFPWWDILIILALIGLNGVLAMSELAIVSARKARLEAMARNGKRGARTALLLASNPGKFLSTVQIGITLIGILAGAYSGASLGEPVGQRLVGLGISPANASEVGFAIVIGLTTYLSLIIGELVPKQFALRAAEPIALVLAAPMLWLARATAPVVWLLDKTTQLVFRLFGLRPEGENTVTVEELQLIVAEASMAGILEESERAIISGVVRLADRPVREIMTPRRDIEWIEADAAPADVLAQLAEMPHNRLPVAEASVDNIIGVIDARDVVTALAAGQTIHPRAIMRGATVVPDQMDAMNVLGVLRNAEVPMALVYDEYGHFEGIVTRADVLKAVAGVSETDNGEEGDTALHQREDGSWLVSGSLSADVLAEKLGFDLDEDRDYATVAGLALAVLRHLPKVGEIFHHAGWQFEVVDMDGRKIDKLLVSPGP